MHFYSFYFCDKQIELLMAATKTQKQILVNYKICVLFKFNIITFVLKLRFIVIMHFPLFTIMFDFFWSKMSSISHYKIAILYFSYTLFIVACIRNVFLLNNNTILPKIE
jgi:hypothetical protein